MRAIAASAGVAEKTVYLAFATKASILNEIIRVAIRGDDQQVPLARRAGWQEMLAGPTDQILPRFAQVGTELLGRTAQVLTLAEAAAAGDSELAKLRDCGHDNMRSDFRQVADALASRGALKAEITVEDATDAIYALANESVYLRLVDRAGWTPERYAEWLAKILTGALLGARG